MAFWPLRLAMGAAAPRQGRQGCEETETATDGDRARTEEDEEAPCEYGLGARERTGATRELSALSEASVGRVLAAGYAASRPRCQTGDGQASSR